MTFVNKSDVTLSVSYELFQPLGKTDFSCLCSSVSGAGNFCLADGLGQLTCDVKSDIRTLNFRSDVIFCTTTKNTECRSETFAMRRKI